MPSKSHKLLKPPPYLQPKLNTTTTHPVCLPPHITYSLAVLSSALTYALFTFLQQPPPTPPISFDAVRISVSSAPLLSPPTPTPTPAPAPVPSTPPPTPNPTPPKPKQPKPAPTSTAPLPRPPSSATPTNTAPSHIEYPEANPQLPLSQQSAPPPLQSQQTLGASLDSLTSTPPIPTDTNSQPAPSTPTSPEPPPPWEVQLSDLLDALNDLSSAELQQLLAMITPTPPAPPSPASSPFPDISPPPVPAPNPAASIYPDSAGSDILVLALYVNDRYTVVDVIILVPSRYAMDDLSIALSAKNSTFKNVYPPIAPGEIRKIQVRYPYLNKQNPPTRQPNSLP